MGRDARRERHVTPPERDPRSPPAPGAGWFLLITGGLFVLAVILGLLTG